MKRVLILIAAIGSLACLQPARAAAQTWFGFSIGVSSAPPPRWAAMRGEPRTVLVGRVAVVDDSRCEDDAFHIDGMWWRMRGGWWYRASRWNGPWAVVDVRRVPRAVLEVPAERWHHHPHAAAAARIRRRERAQDREERAEARHAYGRDHHDDDHGRGDRDR